MNSWSLFLRKQHCKKLSPLPWLQWFRHDNLVKKKKKQQFNTIPKLFRTMQAFPPHPPTSYNRDFFSERFASKKKKTHTQLGCSVNGQMMIDEVAASVVPSSNLNFALNLIPQALLSGRLNPPPRSCCCCCCCNLSFFFCQIP